MADQSPQPMSATLASKRLYCGHCHHRLRILYLHVVPKKGGDNVTRQNSRGSHGSRTVRFHACGNVSLAEGRGAFDKNEPYVRERERGVGRQHGFVQWLFGSRLALVVARAGLVRQATSTVLCDLRGGRRRIRRLVDKQASSLDSGIAGAPRLDRSMRPVAKVATRAAARGW